MRKTLTSKILAASTVGVFALGAVACSSDDTDDPADDPIEDPVEDVGDELEEPVEDIEE